MTTTIRSLLLATALFALAPSAASAAPVDCEPARCAVQAALEEQCPCDQATNHGRHVSCVARVVNKLARDGTVPTNCKGKIRRCAARSICGKPGFVTCHIPTDTCDLTSGTCVEDPAIACESDADCGTRCRIRRTAESCLLVGGTPGAGGSCCSDCVVP